MICENISGVSSKFVCYQIKEKLITGVLCNTQNKVIDDICTSEAWIEDFRVIGKTNVYMQIYFQVYSIVLCKILIDNGKEIFKEESLSILLKCTKAKGWNRKIGILLGPKLDVVLLKEYEEELKEYCQIELSVFELKKKLEKEGDKEVRCVVVYTIDTKAEEIDLKLRKL